MWCVCTFVLLLKVFTLPKGLSRTMALFSVICFKCVLRTTSIYWLMCVCVFMWCVCTFVLLLKVFTLPKGLSRTTALFSVICFKCVLRTTSIYWLMCVCVFMWCVRACACVCVCACACVCVFWCDSATGVFTATMTHLPSQAEVRYLCVRTVCSSWFLFFYTQR